jgi:opacity protein-like surface antigen
VKKWICPVIFMMCASAFVSAQEMPRAEFFAGYSYAGADPYFTGKRTGLNGWEGAVRLNLVSWLGIVADFGGEYGHVPLPVLVPTPFPPCSPFCPPSSSTFSVDTKLYSYLFGADIPYRKWDRFTPFAQLLFGKAHVHGQFGGTSEIDTKFATALGIGADYRIIPRLALRVQGDYLQTKFFANTEDNFRVSAGIVLQLTRKKKTRTLTTP